MSVHRITVKGNSTVRLPTAGKYCDRDIVITAEGGSVELPDLSDPGAAADLMSGKQLIDGEGKIVDGTFTIEEEITEQDALIEQINSALQRKTVGGGLPTQEKTVEVTENGTVEVLPDEGYTLSKVTVDVDIPIPDGYIVPSGTLEVTENGTHDVTAYQSVNVNVEASGGSSDVEVALLTREITEYSNPTLTKLGAYAMSGTNITTLNLPALTEIAGYAFYECTKLTDVVFPSLTEVPYNGMRQYKGLVKCDCHVINYIRQNAFYQCTNLETLIIRSPKVCNIVTGTIFNGSKIQSGTGYIYVPASLVDSYKATSGWTGFANQFRAIEDYPEICG